MKHIEYPTCGTCSKHIHIDVDDEGRVQQVQFVGGCNGNLQGIGALVKGMPVAEVCQRLRGIHCGNKPTSCPDQLAQALEQYK